MEVCRGSEEAIAAAEKEMGRMQAAILWKISLTFLVNAPKFGSYGTRSRAEHHPAKEGAREERRLGQSTRFYVPRTAVVHNEKLCQKSRFALVCWVMLALEDADAFRAIWNWSRA